MSRPGDPRKIKKIKCFQPASTMRAYRFAIRKDTLFLYCRVQKWVEEGGQRWAGTQQKKLYLRKITFFVVGKYVEDARQDEKNIPDLLEAIMRPTDPVNKELWRILMKMHQFGSKISKFKVSTF